VYTLENGRESYPVYDAGGALRTVYKKHDGEWADRISLQNGHPLAKWTTTTLTYLHVDHLGTPIRGTHGLGGSGTLNPGEESFQDFSTPYGLNPTSGWWGNGNSGFDPATGPGSNCGVTGFTTHAKDCESGLQYMQARHYSPVVGRFMSVDPVGFVETGDPHYVNRYAYAGNDPVGNTDPNGRQIRCDVCRFMKPMTERRKREIVETAVETHSHVAVGLLLAASPVDEVFLTVGAVAKGGRALKAVRDATKAVHGNCKSCTKPQHRYEIADQTDYVKKTGISGQPLNQNGSSRRANSQVNQLNNSGDGNTYSATIEETDIPGRAAAIDAEKAATNILNSRGNSLELQQRPKPD